MFFLNSAFLSDGYKTGHADQYPDKTEIVYSNLTARDFKYGPKGCDKIVVFGLAYTVRYIHDHFRHNFFTRPKDEVIREIRQELSMYLGYEYDTFRFEELHDLGHLPICIKTLPEGTRCPAKVPIMTMYNTDRRFYWITNYLETIISNLAWKPVTSATIAFEYKKLLREWAMKTDIENVGFVDFQAHDFSMRGLDSVEAAISSGLGHLTSFKGTDSLPTLQAARYYYKEDGFVGGSVPATEHSVMCAGTKEDEVGTFSRLLNTYPKGILSVVSDTWDLWKVCTQHVVTLKDQILARDGKLVIRPDSGDPVDIICGHKEFTVIKGEYFSLDNRYMPDSKIQDKDIPACKGVVELLWEVFGGTVNKQGYKVLDPHIGVIYGDSITLERAQQICERLEAKGFASTNVVFGVGSFTYQYNTRDTFGFAVKATHVVVDGVQRAIQKNPVTDNGTKKSATGLLKVIKENGELVLKDNVSVFEESEGELKLLYEAGYFHQPNLYSLREIREILELQL